MSQGTRGRWMRVAATGLGVMLCTSLVGCTNWDKPWETIKDNKTVKQGLPGTPKLDAAGNPINKNGQPTNSFGGAGANLQPQNTFNPAQGMGMNQPRYGTTGLNNNNTGSIQPVNWNAQPGMGSGIGAPVQPGVYPAGGSGSTIQYPPRTNTGSGFTSPPEPMLPIGDLVPPSAPIHPSTGGGTEFGSGAPISPGPISPSPTPPVSPPTGFGKGGF